MPRGVPVMSESAALTFGAATSDRVNCGSPASLDDLDPYTVVAWVYPTTLTDLRAIYFKGTSGGNRKILNISGTTGNLQARISRASGSLNYITNNTPLTVNQWNFVAARGDSTDSVVARIYSGTIVKVAVESTYGTAINGAGAFLSEATANAFIGNESGALTAFQGSIAAVAVFKRALSLPEIIAWQFSALDDPFPAVMAGCVGLWYPGNDGPSRVIDYSGYHNDGTVTGATLSRGVALPARNPWLDRLRRLGGIEPAVAEPHGHAALIRASRW